TRVVARWASDRRRRCQLRQGCDEAGSFVYGTRGRRRHKTGRSRRVAHRKGEGPMPKLTVEGVGTFDVPQGKRLVLALEDEAKVDQLHACGGNARCTTCRVEFV